MSQENVALVRSLYTAWGRGDYSAATWAHPGIEFINADGPAPGRWIGHAGMARGWGDFLSAWEDFQIDVDGYRDLKGDRVLVLTRHRGRGKGSGVELGQLRSKGAGVFHIRSGKVSKVVFYWDRERAFADVGLKE